MLKQVKYSLTSLFISYSMMFICKKLSIRGSISNNGPLLLCGTHFNCFLDGLYLLTSFSRRISMIISSHSYKQKGAGFFMRQISSIPINRPMDKRFLGKGQITVHKNEVKGESTSFNSELRLNDFIVIDGKEFKVIKIVSDNFLNILEKYEQTSPVKYNIYPRVDNTECMKKTIGRLKKGQAVSMFPEGETHEQPEMLPLKGGIANVLFNCLGQGFNPEFQCFSYIISSPAKFRTKNELVIGQAFKFDPTILELSKEEMYGIVLDRVKAEIDKVSLPAKTFEEIELAIFIGKLSNIDNFEENKFEVLKGYLEKINRLDDELFNQMRKIKDTAMNLGVSKYTWKNVEETEYKLNLLIGALLLIFFGVGIIIILCISYILNIAVEIHKREVLQKLPYRKTVVDCFNTWRISYIGVINFTGMLFILLFSCIFSRTFTRGLLWTVLFFVYFMFAGFSFDMVLHAKKVIKSYKIKNSEDIFRLNSMRKAFIEEVNLKYGI